MRIAGRRRAAGLAIVASFVSVAGFASMPGGGAGIAVAAPQQVEIDLGAPIQAATAVHMPQGLLIAGIAGGQPFLARTLPTGGLDPTFNPSGPTPGISVDARPSVAWSPAATPELSLWTDGVQRVIVTASAGLAAYDLTDGSPDPVFAQPLPSIAPVGVLQLSDLREPGFVPSTTGGDLLVVGRTALSTASATRVAVVRVTPDGAIDLSYSPGVVAVPAAGSDVTWVSRPQASSRGVVAAVTKLVGAQSVTGVVVLDPPNGGDDTFSTIERFAGAARPRLAASGNFEVVVGADGATGRCLVSPGTGAAPGDCSTDARAAIMQPLRGTTAVQSVAAESVSGIVVSSSKPFQPFDSWLVPRSAGAALLDLLPARGPGEGPVTVLIGTGSTLVIVQDGAGEPPELESARPVRLLDTRTDAVGGAVGPRPADSIVSLNLRGSNGVPFDATAAILNIAAIGPDASGFMTVYPCDRGRPNSSNVNFAAGDVVANTVYVPLGPGGTVCIYTSARSHVLVDLNGSSRSAAPLPGPARLLETRTGFATVDGQLQGIGRREAGSRTTVQVAGRGDVPTTATAAILNVTAVNPGAPGFITVFPCNQPQPVASNVNLVGTGIVANLVYAKLDPTGAVCISTSTGTDLIIDVNGALTRADPVEPRRLLETRSGIGFTTYDATQQGIGRRDPGSTTRLPVAGRVGIAADTVAAMINVTVVNPGTDGFITVYPCDEERPAASNVNYRAGDVVANAVLARIDAEICIYTLAATDLVVDLNGIVPAARVPV